MADQWYNSALVGAVVGVFLGFILSLVPQWCVRYQKRKSLTVALETEIRELVDLLERELTKYLEDREALKEDKPLSFYPMEQTPGVVFRGITPQLEVFSMETVGDLVKFYSLSAYLHHREIVLRGMLKKTGTNKLQPTETDLYLKKIIELTDDLVASGKSLLQILPREKRLRRRWGRPG